MTLINRQRYSRDFDPSTETWTITESGQSRISHVDWELWDIVRALIPAERPECPCVLGLIQVPGIAEPWCVVVVSGDDVDLLPGHDDDDRPPMDFTQGANFAEASWIPKGEIWIDDRVQFRNWAFILYHECGETRYMIRDGMDYDSAHAKVNKEEKELREIYRLVPVQESLSPSAGAGTSAFHPPLSYAAETTTSSTHAFISQRIRSARTHAELAAILREIEQSRFLLGPDYEAIREEVEEKLKTLKHPFRWSRLLMAGGIAALLLLRENRFYRALKRGLTGQVESAVSGQIAHKSVERAENLAPLFDADSWNKTIATIARDNIQTILGDATLAEVEKNIHGRIRTIAGLDAVMPGGKLPLQVERGAREFLGSVMEQPYWAGFGKEAREELQQELHEGIVAGEDREQLKARIRRALGDIADEQAERIARTETTGAFNHGLWLGRNHLARLGILTHTRWRAVDNGHNPTTRPAHAKAHGQTVEVGELFTVGGERCRYPGDESLSAAQRINCRCIAIGVRK
jgi:hypothetical protein